ncbi:MAG TPA: hypothetical protein PL033_00785 [Candidatus Brocadiia bacterium]|nr:hypothetical protein [Candidatus Brocadiia bacterium]
MICKTGIHGGPSRSDLPSDCFSKFMEQFEALRFAHAHPACNYAFCPDKVRFFFGGDV